MSAAARWSVGGWTQGSGRVLEGSGVGEYSDINFDLRLLRKEYNGEADFQLLSNTFDKHNPVYMVQKRVPTKTFIFGIQIFDWVNISGLLTREGVEQFLNEIIKPLPAHLIEPEWKPHKQSTPPTESGVRDRIRKIPHF